MYTLTLNFPPDLRLTTDQYERLAAANRDLRMELTADGKLIIMPQQVESLADAMLI